METPSPTSLPTFVDLMQRCVDQPGKHLDEQSCAHFDAYFLGYHITGKLRGLEWGPRSLSAAIEADFSNGSFSAYSFHPIGLLVAALGEPAALHRRLEYSKTLSSPVDKLEEWGSLTDGNDLINLLGKEGAIRQRPRMYLGSPACSRLLWSMLSGARWAELDAGISDGPVGKFFHGFQAWVEKKNAFSKGIPWGRTLFLISLHSPDHSLNSFFDDFDCYVKRAGNRGL